MMAAMVSAAPCNMGGEILVPPSGQVKLKDKTTPVIEQVSKSGGVNCTAFLRVWSYLLVNGSLPPASCVLPSLCPYCFGGGSRIHRVLVGALQLHWQRCRRRKHFLPIQIIFTS